MKAKNAKSNTTRSIAAAIAGFLFAAVSTVASAQPDDYPRARVDFQAYAELVAEAQQHREDGLIDLDTFLAMSDDPNVIILDTRSKYRYDRLHVAGARHLNFADFTQDNLRQVIPISIRRFSSTATTTSTGIRKTSQRKWCHRRRCSPPAVKRHPVQA